MARSKKTVAKKIAATSARTVGGVISLCLKMLGTILLIIITTGLIFASIFVVYVKTNLSDGLDVKLEDFKPGMGLSSVILGQNQETGQWEELVTLQSTEYRIWVEYDKIPKDMIHALVSIEDERFFNHNGVDWYRTAGAFANMFLGLRESSFGGSTITQQLLKNVTQEDEVTVQRKLTEIFRAIDLENEYEKEEILEWYLSFVYFGHGRYGIGAAANYYFGKEVEDLSLAECASIIGITNNPSIYSPYVSREKNKNRQELILNMMYKQGYIDTEAELQSALKEKLVFQRGEDDVFEPLIYSWFEEAVIEEVVNDLIEQKGYSEKAARAYLTNGGCRIYSTIDLSIQEKMDSVYKNLEEIPVVKGSSQQIQSAMIIADPYTGDIKALAGGVGEKKQNLLRNNATRARRPPGSTIKPLSVYSPAMENGLITPDTKLDDSMDVVLTGRDDWLPHNDDWSESGIITVRTAVIRSKNVIAAQVLDQLTPSESYRFMTQKLGFSLAPEDENYAALSLGQLHYGATVKEMTSAYTMFDNAGVRTELRTYTKVTDAEGKEIILEKIPKQTAVISETTAYWMTDMLRQAATSGTGHEANLGNMPTAGKTGTTSDKKDRWFAGYTPYYVGVVWTGYEIPAVMQVSGNPASQIWKKVMSKVHEDLEPREFNKPANTYLPPVEGVLEVEYTIRYVDTYGVQLSIETQTGVVDREVTAKAMPLPDYILISEPEIAITLGENPEKNVIEFIYEKDEPEPEPDPFDPWDTQDPWNTGEQPDPNDTQDPDNSYVGEPAYPDEPDDTQNTDEPVVG